MSIICFAASYAVALGLEITRLLFRSGVRGVLMIGFAAAGLFAHTAYLAHLAAGANGLPLSSMRDWYLLAAWALAAVYLYLSVYHPKTPFGLFILPLVLGLVGVARFFADTTPFPREPASQVWGVIHATSILLATVAVLVGFVAGLMYLGQARRLKRKQPPPRGFRLPSLEWLQRANGRAMGISSLMLGLGIVSGVILNVIHDERRLHQLPWSDPLILSTVGMFGWLVVATGVSLFYRPAREGRRVACLTIVSFLFLVLALSVGLFFNSSHVGTRPGGEKRAVEDGRKANARRKADGGLPVENRPLRIAHYRSSAAGHEGETDERAPCGANRGSNPADGHPRALSFLLPPRAVAVSRYSLLPAAYLQLPGGSR